MTTIQLSESNPENQRQNWHQIMIMLQPIVDNMPRKDDRDYFKGIMSLLIGKEPRISNIPSTHMYVYIQWADLIVLYWSYKSVIGIDYIRATLVRYLNRLALHLSEKGLFVKYGFSSHTQQFMEQKIKQETERAERKKGWLS